MQTTIFFFSPNAIGLYGFIESSDLCISSSVPTVYCSLGDGPCLTGHRFTSHLELIGFNLVVPSSQQGGECSGLTHPRGCQSGGGLAGLSSQKSNEHCERNGFLPFLTCTPPVALLCISLHLLQHLLLFAASQGIQIQGHFLPWPPRTQGGVYLLSLSSRSQGRPGPCVLLLHSRQN